MATPYDTNLAAANSAFRDFAAKLRDQLAALQAGVDYAADSALLQGLTAQEIIDMSATAAGQTIAEVQTQLDAFILEMDGVPREVATMVEAADSVTPLDTVAMTPASFWHALNSFWTQQVGAAPATLDEIHEIAAAITDNADAIAAINTIAGQKVDQTVYDAGILNLQNQIDALVIPIAATQAEVDAGTVADAYVAPNTLKVRLDALRASIEADVNAGFDAMRQAFVDGLGILEGTVTWPTV